MYQKMMVKSESNDSLTSATRDYESVSSIEDHGSVTVARASAEE